MGTGLNPGIIVNGFIHSGILGDLYGETSEDSSMVDDQEITSELDSDDFEPNENVLISKNLMRNGLEADLLFTV